MPTDPATDPTPYDAAILGAGQAGTPLAAKLAARGWRVALAERARVGGSCVNFGCTPTKAALASAGLAAKARRAAEFGLRIPTVEIDFPAVLARARGMAEESRRSIADKLDRSDVDLIRGHARLAGRDGDLFRLEIDTASGPRTIRARRVVLDTGTRALIPPIDGLDQIDPITAGNWLDQTALPRRLVMVGGGYIGLEGGQAYQRVGAAVTVVESGAQLLAKEEPEIAEALRKCLEGEGMQFRLNARVQRVERGGGAIRVHLSTGESLETDAVYLAAGRKPNTDDLGLGTVGIEPTEKGIVPVDERLKTSVEGIWAAGDIRGGPMFTHNAHADHHVILAQFCGPDETSDGTTAGRVVPWGVFTDPPLGRVGLTEREARDAGHSIRVAKMPAEKSDRHRESGERAGLLKLVVDAATGKVLGATCLCHAGPEIVHAFVGLMNAGLPVGEIRRSIFIHPTYTEAARSLVFALDGGEDEGC